MSLGSKTSISWCDETWNPTSGCTKVSPGCDNCYAERFAERWRGIAGHSYEQGFDLKLHPKRLEYPYDISNKRIFVNSMSDLFHRDIPDEFILRVFQVMADTTFCPNRNTYQVLTKRPDRMRHLMPKIWPAIEPRGGVPLHEVVMPNIWLGVSVENVDYSWRAGMLRETPAAVRFLSCEPLLGHIPAFVLRDMNWVIVGGESGPRARPMDTQWARNIRDDCEATGIAFFMKQVSGYRPKDAQIPEDLRIREFPKEGNAA